MICKFKRTVNEPSGKYRVAYHEKERIVKELFIGFTVGDEDELPVWFKFWRRFSGIEGEDFILLADEENDEYIKLNRGDYIFLHEDRIYIFINESSNLYRFPDDVGCTLRIKRK